jgi:ABC-2 type transport system permease protein
VALRLLLRKEFRALFREPMVVLMIIMPLIVYGGMSPFYKGATEQAVKAAKLRGVNVAVAGCGRLGYTVASLIAERLRAAGVSKVASVESCNPIQLLQRYDVVLLVNASSLQQVAEGKARIVSYVRGDISKLMRTLALPSAVLSKLGETMGAGKARIRMESYVYMRGRVWSYEQLNNLYSFASTLSYATFFILFPAASLGAALIGAEREERVLEVLFSLPIRRRDIALAKALAAIAAAVLTALSALAGFYMLLRGGLGQKIAGSLASYYGATGLAAYIAALGLEALFVASLAMIAGLFTTSIRGAQSASMITALPALIPPFLLITGIPLSIAFAAAPYTAAVIASLYPLIPQGYLAASLTAQAVETLAALLALVKLLESEVAVTGPETVKRLFRKLRRRRTV